MTRFLRHTPSKDLLFPNSAHIFANPQKQILPSAQDDNPLLK